VRTHDLRHTAIRRMIDGGVPLPKIAKIIGWSASTMVKMAARYGHFNTDELRGAVEAISRPEAHSPMGSPVFSPVSPEGPEKEKSKLLKELAPQVGLEPTTLRLTAECSAIELLRSVWRDVFD
jgi:hypothetical protein